MFFSGVLCRNGLPRFQNEFCIGDPAGGGTINKVILNIHFIHEYIRAKPDLSRIRGCWVSEIIARRGDIPGLFIIIMKIYNSLINKVIRRNIKAPALTVLFIDIAFVLLSSAVAAALVTRFRPVDSASVLVGVSIIVTVRIVSFLTRKTYMGIVRYINTSDILGIFWTLTIPEIALIILNLGAFMLNPKFSIPFLLLLIEYNLLLFLMVFSRLVFKLIIDGADVSKHLKAEPIIIFGGNKYLILLKELIDNTPKFPYEIRAFINADEGFAGKKLAGIPVYGVAKLDELLAACEIETLLIAQNKKESFEARRRVIDSCIRNGVKIKEIPLPDELISGKISLSRMRDLKIEDLLQRDVIELDKKYLEEQLTGKTVLVTGAAGSIGSELVRQLTTFRPSQIVLVDIAESALYDLELELKEDLHFTEFTAIMSDIRDITDMRRIFREFRPQVVYHAAAYKHVPMIEKLPLQGVHTNILGTRLIADLADRYHCSKFVMVSTDKAVNPTNVMGCTKRIAEIYIQSLNSVSRTAFITTRFGNVLGSNGSVVPRFLRQIECGGPVTVTHPEINRFFMTIPEACQLVLQAGGLGNGGEIFVFDMGKSVKILDLAKKMIHLSGLIENQDIEIVFTGIRPGEKLYEEVLNDDEQEMPTVHSRIHKARVREYDYDTICAAMDHFAHIIGNGSGDWDAVRYMKKIVPEFKSRNSIYEELDIQIENDDRKVGY